MKQIIKFLIAILMFLGNGLLIAQIENEKIILTDEEGKIQGYVPDFNLCNPIKLKVIGDNVDDSQWKLYYRYQEKLTDPWANSDILNENSSVWVKADKSNPANDPYFFIPSKLITKPRISKKEKIYNKQLDKIKEKSENTQKSEYKRNRKKARHSQKLLKWSNKIETRTKNYAGRKSKNNKYFLVYNLVKKEQLNIADINRTKETANDTLKLTNQRLKSFNECISLEKNNSDSIKKIIGIINNNITTLKADRDAYLSSNECCIESVLLNIQKEIDELQDSMTYYQHLQIKPSIIVDGSTDNIKTLEEKKTKLETEIAEINKKLNSNRYFVKHLGVIVLGRNTAQTYYKSEYNTVTRFRGVKCEEISIDRIGDYPEIIEGDYVYPTLLNVKYTEARLNPIRMKSKLTAEKNPPLYDPGFAPIGTFEEKQLNKSALPTDDSSKSIELILETAYTDLVYSIGKPMPGNYNLSVEFKKMGDSTVENVSEEVITKGIDGKSVEAPKDKKSNYFTTTKKYENTTITILKDEFPTSHKLYRFGAAFGLLASFLNNPVYTKELVAPASPETGGKDIYKITEKNNYSPTLHPTVFFNINLKRVDLQKKKMNCYERLSIGFGFDITDISNNFYTGLNFSVWRNFLISAGAHFGMVEIMSGTQDYNSPNAVTKAEELRVGFFVGLQWNYNIGSIIKKWSWE